jgi:glycine cleavage system H protein
MLMRAIISRARAPVRLLSTLYAPSHEYIKVNGNIGTVGITDHAAGALGDIVYVELPQIGKSIKAGESFGSVV